MCSLFFRNDHVEVAKERCGIPAGENEKEEITPLFQPEPPSRKAHVIAYSGSERKDYGPKSVSHTNVRGRNCGSAALKY